MKISRIAWAAALLFCFGVFAATASSVRAAASIGQKAPDFTIPDAVTDSPVSLSALLQGHKAVVLIFVSTKCPFSNGYNDRMETLYIKYGDLGVSLLGVNSNSTEEEGDIYEHKLVHHLTFPILKDYNNVVADAYGASHTPEAYVIDANGILVYHGRIDDSLKTSAVKTHDLADALDEVLAGKPVLVPTTKAFGCSIKRIGM